MKKGKYELGRMLGEGNFGKVKFARRVDTGEAFAVKILDRKRILDLNITEQIKREITTLKLLKHPNVVRLHEVNWLVGGLRRWKIFRGRCGVRTHCSGQFAGRVHRASVANRSRVHQLSNPLPTMGPKWSDQGGDNLLRIYEATSRMYWTFGGSVGSSDEAARGSTVDLLWEFPARLTTTNSDLAALQKEVSTLHSGYGVLARSTL